MSSSLASPRHANSVIGPAFKGPAFKGVAKSVSKRLAWLLALAACALQASNLPAQDNLGSAAGTVTQPVAIATIGNINQLTRDINYLGGVMGQPQLGAGFAMLAGMYTEGIDTSQPIGVIVPLIDGAPEPIAMLPAADVKSVLKRLEPQTGPADELDDGTLVIAIGANTIFIRQMGPWAMLARNRTVLDQAPANPAALISELGSEYDLAVKLDMQQIPAATRDALIDQLRQGFDQAMSKQNEEAEATRQYAQQSMDQLEQFVSQTDDLMIGLDVDSSERQIVIDMSYTALPGTQLAKIYESQKPVPSAFSSVVREGAAAYFHCASAVGPETMNQARVTVENAIQMLSKALGQADELSDSEQEEAREIIQRIANLLLSSYEEGVFDAGAVLLTDESKMQFVGGAFVADGGEAAQIVKDIAAKLATRDDTSDVQFEFDRDTYKNVTMHLVKVAIPEKQDELRKVLGAQGRLHLGTADKAVFIALGDASLPLMMELIDSAQSKGKASDKVVRMQMNLMPIFQFAQSLSSNDSIASMIDALSRADDAGQLDITSTPITNGQSASIVLGDGLLQAIGAMARKMQMARMQNQF